MTAKYFCNHVRIYICADDLSTLEDLNGIQLLGYCPDQADFDNAWHYECYKTNEKGAAKMKVVKVH